MLNWCVFQNDLKIIKTRTFRCFRKLVSNKTSIFLTNIIICCTRTVRVQSNSRNNWFSTSRTTFDLPKDISTLGKRHGPWAHSCSFVLFSWSCYSTQSPGTSVIIISKRKWLHATIIPISACWRHICGAAARKTRGVTLPSNTGTRLHRDGYWDRLTKKKRTLWIFRDLWVLSDDVHKHIQIAHLNNIWRFDKNWRIEI